MMIEAVKLLRSGLIGDVLVAKCWNIQRRRSIGHDKPSSVPVGLDYDTWLGPAPHVAYQKNRCHDGWHWWYDFGTGDIGNDGIHDVDYTRWGLGVETHPSKISASGGKFFFDDDQQFPDTQQVAFEYAGGRPFGPTSMPPVRDKSWRRVIFDLNGSDFHSPIVSLTRSSKPLISLSSIAAASITPEKDFVPLASIHGRSALWPF